MFRVPLLLELINVLIYLGLSGFIVVGVVWKCLPNDAELGVERCSLYSSLPGPLQTVQRAEMCGLVGGEGGREGGGVILPLQAMSLVHVGVDNLNVVRHVSRILSGVSRGCPLELCMDGARLTIIADFVRKRGKDSVQVAKVKGHADDCMARDGMVRALDKAGNDLADKAGDLRRMRLPTRIIDYSALLPVGNGTLSFLTFAASSLQLRVWLSMKMTTVGPLHIRLFGIGERILRKGILPGYPALRSLETWVGRMARYPC